MVWLLCSIGVATLAFHGDWVAAGTGVENRNKGTGQAEACPVQPPWMADFGQRKSARFGAYAPLFIRFPHPTILIYGS